MAKRNLLIFSTTAIHFTLFFTLNTSGDALYPDMAKLHAFQVSVSQTIIINTNGKV